MTQLFFHPFNSSATNVPIEQSRYPQSPPRPSIVKGTGRQRPDSSGHLPDSTTMPPGKVSSPRPEGHMSLFSQPINSQPITISGDPPHREGPVKDPEIISKEREKEWERERYDKDYEKIETSSWVWSTADDQ